MENILVCTDGSRYAEVCCRYAAWLARRTGAHIHALYVSDLWEFETSMLADFSGSLGVQPYQGVSARMQELEKEKSELLENAVRGILKEEGIQERLNFHHSTGLLVDSIDDFEEGEGAVDLIMLGKRGENANLARGHLGANMERVVRASSKPCLVTNRKFAEIKRVCLAYDASESTRRAAAWLKESVGFNDLRLDVVTVDEEDPGQDALGMLREAEATLKEGGFDPHCQMLNGTPENAICEYVEDNDVDMLIMGAYGHSRIREFLIGSTTTDLVRRARMPVMLFR